MKVKIAPTVFLSSGPDDLLLHIISFIGWKQRWMLCALNKQWKKLVESAPLFPWTDIKKDFLFEQFLDKVSISSEIPKSQLPQIGPLIRRFKIACKTRW